VRSHPTDGDNPCLVGGSISACAESSSVDSPHGSGSGVYLRVCGVIVAYRSDITCPEGLSPRVRSHQKLSRGKSRTLGSISACAESSLPRVQAAQRLTVYLRVCGVIMDGLAVGAAITLAVILAGFVYFYLQTLD